MPDPYRLDLGNGKTLEFIEGDITRESTDAVVNAANSSLMGGGGVDGAIHRRGGPAILEACKKIRQEQYPKGLPTGSAVATTAGHLPAKHVIHTVGPVWHGGGGGEAERLASCYRESIRVAEELKLTSVAFPSVSTGVYGYPVAQAAEVAVATVLDALRAAEHVKTVRLVLFGAHDYRVYTEHARNITRS
jgi:O-acetyl-ADP-ribose deacetylase (regulator of RNase III)